MTYCGYAVKIVPENHVIFNRFGKNPLTVNSERAVLDEMDGVLFVTVHTFKEMIRRLSRKES